MQKKFLSVIMCIVMLIPMMSVGVPTIAADYTSADGVFTYTLSGGKATITGAVCSFAGDMVIDTVDGYPVTKIANNAFKGQIGIKGVTLADSVLVVGQYAFKDCTGIEALD